MEGTQKTHEGHRFLIYGLGQGWETILYSWVNAKIKNDAGQIQKLKMVQAAQNFGEQYNFSSLKLSGI